MSRLRYASSIALTALLFIALPARADESFAKTSKDVNTKLVKLFGAGGLKGLHSYGSGVLVSDKGHILTVASHILQTEKLQCHTYFGKRYECKMVIVEPALDAAIVQIKKLDDELPYFDITKAAKQKVAEHGDWILAFSNQFKIATRDEPMSVQRGVICAYAKLRGRKGVNHASYKEECYIIDAICNNPGAGGGVITTRKGELLGLIGKELRNTLTETWINYAVPVQKLDKFVEGAIAGTWRTKKIVDKIDLCYHGIALVPRVVRDITPPYVETLADDSPAAKAGLKADDLIVYIDGEPVSNIETFIDLMKNYKPGDEVTFEVRRNDAESGEKLVTIKFKVDAPKKQPKPKDKEK